MPTPSRPFWFTDGDELTVSFDRHTAVIHADDVELEVSVGSLLRFLRVYELTPFPAHEEDHDSEDQENPSPPHHPPEQKHVSSRPEWGKGSSPHISRFRWHQHPGSDEMLLELGQYAQTHEDWESITTQLQHEFGRVGTADRIGSPSMHSTKTRHHELQLGRVQPGQSYSGTGRRYTP